MLDECLRLNVLLHRLKKSNFRATMFSTKICGYDKTYMMDELFTNLV